MQYVVITVIIAGFAGMALLGYKYLMVNTVDSVVNHQKYLGNHSNPAEIYTSPSTGQLFSPLNISVVQMDKLMLVDIEDDPEYSTIELQTFDDARGQAARVLLYRHDRPADSYYTNAAYVINESEPNSFYIAPDIAYRFDVMTSGLNASLRMQDHTGKSIEFRVNQVPRKKLPKGFLAPIGGSDAVTFRYFPFFYMKEMSFLPRSGTKIVINIAGEVRKPRKLPIPANWEFVYLSRYTATPIIACWNTPHDGELPPLQPEQSLVYQDRQTRYELTNNAGHYEIRGMVGFDDKHEVRFDFSPPIPDLPSLKDGVALRGRFSAGTGGTLGIIAGDYHISRQGNIIDMQIHPRKGWQPMPGRSWVTTWIWKGKIIVGANRKVSMKSTWIRTQ